MKYEYLLHTWGGFYNEEHQEKHGELEGYHYFYTEKERDNYITKLRKIEKDLNAKHLAIEKSEGYNTRTITTLHRVSKYKGKEYYTKNNLPPNYSYSAARYTMKNKWYPGFNDYPLGENFDYDNEDFEIVQEWITGAFDISDDDVFD